nr:MAG TPA: hypothetical protein [Caudoviricetes sp.]
MFLAFPRQLEEQGQCWPLVRQRQQRHRQCLVEHRLAPTWVICLKQPAIYIYFRRDYPPPLVASGGSLA